jgi:hypothetical protein
VGSGILESAHQFALLGIDTGNRMAATLEPLSQIGAIEELIVPIRRVVGGKFLVFDGQGIAHLMEEAGKRVGSEGPWSLFWCLSHRSHSFFWWNSTRN